MSPAETGFVARPSRPQPTRQTARRWLYSAVTLLCWLAAANVAVVGLFGSYDLTLIGHHFVAHQAFKPLLFLNGVLWLALLFGSGAQRGAEPRDQPESRSVWRDVAIGLGLVLAVTALYWHSTRINVRDSDWNHRLLSAGIHSWRDALRLFAEPKADGFYRPIGFLSLWLDYAVFGPSLWGYHLQSIAFHACNAVLVFVLARRLGLRVLAAGGAALMFACAAVNFEPVLWPAARFDLLATAFALSSVIVSLRYLQEPGSGTGCAVLSAGLYLLGLLSKETAFCIPAVMLTLVLTLHPRPARAKLQRLAVCVALATIVALAARVAVYHGFGGYPPPPSGEDPHFRLTAKTLETITTRPLGIPFLGINSTVPLSLGLRAMLVVFALAAGVLATQRPSPERRERVIGLLAIISALPALNLVGWVGPSMQNARYLYLPGVWLFLFLGALAARTRAGTAVVAAVVLANAAGVLHNLEVYRSVLGRVSLIADQIRGATAREGVRAVYLAGVPATPHGVFFFSRELVLSLSERSSVRQIARQPAWCVAGEAPGDAVFIWNDASESLDGPAHCRPRQEGQ
jgi:hypothetical protein